MTHLLPGGGVPRVHRARSSVPPRGPHFATPPSVHRLAAVAAGAYPPRRPPNAWSPGLLAPPGPCYWLVASGTPLGWRRSCLAVGLVRGAVRHYCLGGCTALVVCAQRSRPVRGGWGRCRVLCLPRFPLPAPLFLRCVWRAVPSGCPLSSLAGTPFHAVCAFRGLGPDALLVFPASPLCGYALTLSRRRRPPPLPGLVWPAHLAGSQCWVLVGPFLAVPAPPRVLPRSRAPFGLLWGGGGGPVSFPPTWPGAARSPGGECGRGDPPPTPPRALLQAGCARCGSGTRVPGGGASCLGVGRPGLGALPPPTTPLFGHAAGAHYPLAVGAGGPGMGTRHQLHSAGSCELALPAVGAARGRPGGAPLAWVWGVRGRALSHPGPLPYSGVRPGPTTHWLWVRGVRRGDQSPTPRRALLRACFARCGGSTRAPGGGASCLGILDWALPPPTARPLGCAAGVHYPLAVGAGGAGVGTRHQPHSAHS